MPTTRKPLGTRLNHIHPAGQGKEIEGRDRWDIGKLENKDKEEELCPTGSLTCYIGWKEPMPLGELGPRGRYSPTTRSRRHCEARVKPWPSSSSDHGQPPAGGLTFGAFEASLQTIWWIHNKHQKQNDKISIKK